AQGGNSGRARQGRSGSGGAGLAFRSSAAAEHRAAKAGSCGVARALWHLFRRAEGDGARRYQREDGSHGRGSPAHARSTSGLTTGNAADDCSLAGLPGRRLQPSPTDLGLGFFFAMTGWWPAAIPLCPVRHWPTNGSCSAATMVDNAVVIRNQAGVLADASYV